MQRFISCAVLVTLMHSAAPANAQGPGLPTEVRLHVDGCTDSGWSPAIVRGVRLELRVEGVQRVEHAEARESESEETPDTAWVLITGPCTDPNLVLRVENRTTGNSMDWQLDLSDVRQPARPRVISLAAAELLRASWPGLIAPETPDDAEEVVRDSLSRAASAEVRGALRLDPPPPSSVTPVAAGVHPSSSVTPVTIEADANISDAPPGRTLPREREPGPSRDTQDPPSRSLRFVSPKLWLGAAALGRIFVAEATWVAGVRTQLRWRWLEVGVEFAGGVDTHRLGLGRARVMQIGLGVGVVPLSLRRGKWGGEAGLFAQVGSTRLDGVAHLEGVRASSIAGVDARFSLRATLQYHFLYRVLLFGIDGGYSIGFEGFADGERFASTNGFALGLSLGLGGLVRVR